jgi:hypothetical protein
MRYIALFVSSVMILLTACAPAPVRTAQPFERSPLATSPLPTPEVPGTADTGEEPGKKAEEDKDAVIIYEREGGLAGTFEHWTVYPDGRIVSDKGLERQVQAEEVAALLDKVKALGFFDMSASYGPPGACCDRYTYHITVRSGDRTNTVRTIDGAADAPPELGRIIVLIQRLMSGAKQ